MACERRHSASVMDEAKAAFSPPDGGYGWVIILATTLINICVLPLVQCFGIIYERDFKLSGVTAAQTSFLLHLHSAIYCSLGLLGSPLLKKYDFRRVALFGTCLMCLGIFLSSFTRAYGVLICTFAVIVGVGQGIMLPATYVATNTYFKKRLTLAVSFSVTGASISYVFMPQVCNKLLAVFGNTQGTVSVLGGFSLIAIACCFLLRPVDTKPADVETKEEVQNPEMELLNVPGQIYKDTTVPRKTFFSKIYELFNLELLNDRSYVIAIVGMSISFASELNVILMISFILPELAGFKTGDVALALSVQSVADIVGRLAVPVAGHYFNMGPKVMYAVSLVTATLGRIGLALFYVSKPTIFACASLIGLAKGTKAVYQSVIIPKLVTLEKLPAANGLNMLLTGVLSLVVGPVIGGIRDVSGSYIYALHASSCISIGCVVLWIVDYFAYERKRARAAVTLNNS